MKTLKISSICFASMLALSLSSCGDHKPDQHSGEIATTVTNENEVAFAGVWLQENYYNTLMQTNSPQKAQDNNVFKFIKIGKNWSDEVAFIHNFHEGAGPGSLTKHNNEIYMIDEEYTTPMDANKVTVIDNNTITIGKDKYIKVGTEADFNDDIVSKIMLNKSYTYNGNTVKFLPSNKVEGLAAFSYYKIKADYMGPGENLDRILLGKNEDDSKAYAFEIKNNTLNIYEDKCATNVDDSECEAYVLDKLVYQISIN